MSTGISPGSPVHTRSVTTSDSEMESEYENMTLSRLADKMCPFFVGPITAQEFLDSFLPPPPTGSSVPPFEAGMFGSLIQAFHKQETEWYTVFNEIVSPHLKNFVITNTSDSSKTVEENKFPFESMPACSVYMSCHNKDYFDTSCVDFVVAFKRNWKDPFVDNPSDSGSFSPFLSSEGQIYEVLGHLTAYAAAILSTQYRTHLFMVLLFKEHARLIRWDRCGAVVTEAICFNEEPYLFNFFIHYDTAGHEARGHDSTVSLPTKDEIIFARTIVPEFSDITSFLAIATQDQDTYTSSRFIIPHPGPQFDVPVGRWTRSSLACDMKRKRRVYLKDSWQVLLKDMEPEGKIYHRLHEKKVPNVSSCLWAGNVGIDIYHQSQTDKIVNKCHSLQSHWRLTPHQHYRIVLGVVGRELEKFNNTWEFVNAMYAALKAHKAAYDAGILHRDISAWNILIVGPDELPHSVADCDDQPESRIEGGMLIDWDLSKIVNTDDGSSATHHTCTGTWLFMAADLIQSSDIEHTFIQDLESFFWVLIWVIVTQVKSSWSDIRRSRFLHMTMTPQFYDHNQGKENMMIDTGIEKAVFLQSTELRNGEFEIPGNPTLRDFLVGLKMTFAVRYQKPTKYRSPYDLFSDLDYEKELKSYQDQMKYFENHDRILSLFKKAVAAKWPNNDKAKTQNVLQPRSAPLKGRSNLYGQSSAKRSWSVIEGGADSVPESSDKKRKG